MNRNRIILAALLGILALCLIYAYLATPRLEKAPPRTAKQPARSEAKVSSTVANTSGRIDFDFMKVEPRKFSGAKRDIFSYGRRRPVRSSISTRPAPKPEIQPKVVMPESSKRVSVAMVNQALSQFTFLGFMEKAGEKTVFLSSSGSLFLVKRGEKFGVDKELLVVDINDNLLKVQHADRKGLIEIPLIEKQKLRASASSPAQMAPVEVQPKQIGPRIFTPQRRVNRPVAPHGDVKPFPETNRENSPEEKQEKDLPVEGDELEGEINGTNQ
jgi:hypothetical protein